MDAKVNDSHRSLMGLPHHALVIAFWRELGWMGVSYSIATKVLSMFRSIMRLPFSHVLRVALRDAATWRQESTGRDLRSDEVIRDGRTYHLHPCIADMTAQDRAHIYVSIYTDRIHNFFLLHLFAIADAIGIRSVVRHAVLKNPAPWTDTVLKGYTKNKLRNKLATILHEKLQQTRAKFHYPLSGKWDMLGDVAAMSPADMRTGYLLVIHLRTNAHYLGSGASKRMKPRPTTELCPSCWAITSDTPTHAMLFCKGRQMLALRQRYLHELIECITMQNPREPVREPSDPALIRQIFGAGCNTVYAKESRKARRILREWATHIKHEHDEWRRYPTTGQPRTLVPYYDLRPPHMRAGYTGTAHTTRRHSNESGAATASTAAPPTAPLNRRDQPPTQAPGPPGTGRHKAKRRRTIGRSASATQRRKQQRHETT
jgi:hypothetical protein